MSTILAGLITLISLMLLQALKPAKVAPQVSAEPAPYHWYKGNTHTHSLWSDGNDFPEMIVRWYREKGYDFLALTDHNILSRESKWMRLEAIEKRRSTLGKSTFEKYLGQYGEPWVETRGEGALREVRLKRLDEFRTFFEAPNEFLLIEAEEISDSFEGRPIHQNVLNPRHVIPPQGGSSASATIDHNVRAAAEQATRFRREVLVHLNHPNFGWALSPKDVAEALEAQFFEVYNGHPTINHLGDSTRPGDESLWDIANTMRLGVLHGQVLLGIASDDSHTYHGGDVSPGRGWVMVRSQSLAPNALIGAMKRGDFYASSGVSLEEIRVDRPARTLGFRIVAEPGVIYHTEFIGTRSEALDEPGVVFATSDSLAPQYQMTGEELYVRATVTASSAHPNPSFPDQRKQAWTQPVVPE